MKGKKGLEQTLVALILLLAVAVLLFFFGYGFSRWAEKQGTVEGCRISVLAAAQLGKGTVAGKFSGAPLDFECPPTDVTIKEDKAIIDGFEKKFSDEKSYEENVKRVIADQLAQCWYKFGEGKVDAFQQYPLVDVSNYVCFYCSYIKFENPPVKQISGMNTYLEEQKIPLGVVTQDSITYTDYIMQNYDQKTTQIYLAITPTLYPAAYYASYNIILQVRPADFVGIVDLTQYILYFGATPEKCEYYYE